MFIPETAEGLPETQSAEEEITFQIRGDLTIREVTNPATFAATVWCDKGFLSGNALAVIWMSYGR
jgi:polyisoprenoid-binding protein YceI